MSKDLENFFNRQFDEHNKVASDCKKKLQSSFLNVTNKVSKINLDTQILLVHGDEDNVVPMEMTKTAKKHLNSLGYFVNTYFSKGLGHGISLDGLAEATKFLKN